MFSSKKGLTLTISLFVLLLAVAFILPAAFTQQGSAESSSVQYTTTTADIAGASLIPPVKYLEVDINYNYHIPSDEEIAATKQKLMKEEKFKDKVEKKGKQQAEEELDTGLKKDVDFLKQKNNVGSEKVQLIEIGEHSAYISAGTWSVDQFDNCTTPADPINLFFYDTGYIQNVNSKLYSAGWSNTSWGDNQCAYTSNTSGSFSVSDLRKQTIQVNKGYDWFGTYLNRDHMRMWEGGWGTGTEGSWSIGSVHHEYTSTGELDHCLWPYDPNGSSFDLAEGFVWNDALGRYPHFFYDGLNARHPDGSSWSSCGHTVNHDGISVGVDIPSDVLKPGQALAPGQHRNSSDLRFMLIYQTDGNLVLYQMGVGAALWSIGRQTSPGFAIMQNDGNFVTYNPSWQPYWASHTDGNLVQGLFVQNDGNVVIYNTNGAPIWASGTCCR